MAVPSSLSNLNLTTFNKIYPLLIQKYNTLVPDPTANILDKINSIVDYLNSVGSLSNEVVDNWNKVMSWTMNDGLTTDVNNKIEAMNSSGELNSILTSLFNAEIGDLTTLQTNDKSKIVNAINEVEANTKSNATSLADIAINVMYPPTPLVGAKGDGVTDDYASLQNLHDYCFNNNIHKMYFPQPSNFYAISKPLLLKTTSQGVQWWDGKAIKLEGADKATTRIVKTTNNTLSGVNSEVNGVDATILLYDATDGTSGTGIQLKHLYVENQSTAAGSYPITGQACQRMIIEDCNFKSTDKGLYFPGMFSSTIRDVVIYCTQQAINIFGNCTSNIIEKVYCSGVKNPYFIQSDYSNIHLLYADGATGAVFELKGLGLLVGSLGTESPKAQYVLKSDDLSNKIQVESIFCFRQTGDSVNNIPIANCAIVYGQGDIIVKDISILNNDVISGNSYVYDCGTTSATNSFEVGRIHYYSNVSGNPPLLFSNTAGDIGSGGKWNAKESNVNYRKNGIMPFLGSVKSNNIASVNFRDKAIYLDNETGTTTSWGDVQWMEKYNVGDVLLINNPLTQNKLGYVVTGIGGNNAYVRDCQLAEIPINLTGTTANRPTQNLFVGLHYYDTTLGKPIWCHQVSPVIWHDATGASV